MKRLLAFFGLDPGSTDEDVGHGGRVSPSTFGGGMTVKGENITARVIVIAGVVRGNLSADTRVEFPTVRV